MEKIQLKPKIRTEYRGRKILYYVCEASPSDIQEAYDREHTECGQIPCKSIDGMGRINLYNSITEAHIKTGVDRSSISRCMKGEYKHAGGLVWSSNE